VYKRESVGFCVYGDCLQGLSKFCVSSLFKCPVSISNFVCMSVGCGVSPANMQFKYS